IARGVIKPKADEKDLVACVVEMMSENFEIEAQIDAEADRMADELARKASGPPIIRRETQRSANSLPGPRISDPPARRGSRRGSELRAGFAAGARTHRPMGREGRRDRRAGAAQDRVDQARYRRGQQRMEPALSPLP